MRIKNLNAKSAEEAQRTAEVDIPEFLCGKISTAITN
jgi:hypothetical protein